MDQACRHYTVKWQNHWRIRSQDHLKTILNAEDELNRLKEDLLPWKLGILSGLTKCSLYFFNPQAKFSNEVGVVSCCWEWKVDLPPNELIFKLANTSIRRNHLCILVFTFAPCCLSRYNSTTGLNSTLILPYFLATNPNISKFSSCIRVTYHLGIPRQLLHIY